MRYVTYSKSEENIVEQGVTAIQEVLMGTDDDAKASLLFCLDKYLDPYYGYNLPYANDIFDLLETVVVLPNAIEIREDALELLTGFAGGPFPILERHFDDLPEEIKPEVKYAINMFITQKTEVLVLEECIRLFQENQALNKEHNMGNFPKEAIVVHNTMGDADGNGYDNWDTIEEIWSIEDGKYKAQGIPTKGIQHVHNPISGAFYPLGEFYFNIKPEEKEVYLSYIFGPRYGRGFVYEIKMDGSENVIGLVNPKVLWAM